MQGEWNRVRVWSITWLSSPPDFCLTYTPTSKEKGPISVLCFVWEHNLYLESVSAPVSLWTPLLQSCQGCSLSLAGPRTLHPSQQRIVSISQSVPVTRVRKRRLWGADIYASKGWETSWRIQLSSAQCLKHLGLVLRQDPAGVWSHEQEWSLTGIVLQGF